MKRIIDIEHDSALSAPETFAEIKSKLSSMEVSWVSINFRNVVLKRGWLGGDPVELYYYYFEVEEAPLD